MKQKGPVTLIVATNLCWVLFAPVVAQEPAPAGGSGRVYDPTTVETVSGEVLQVERIPHVGGAGYGVHLRVKTDTETIPVDVGPGWYLDAQMLRAEVGDRVTVTGSRVARHGEVAIVAAEVRKGNQVLRLRDERGIPAWSRGGEGRRRGR